MKRSTMEKLTLYLKESYHELTKEVHWPTASQLQESTMVVLSTATILALIIFLMDNACGIVIKKGIYGL